MTAPMPTSPKPVVLLVQPSGDDGLEMYEEFLRHQGLAPIAVTNGSDALSAAPQADVVVTGILLTGTIDGIELIARLRAEERTRHIPIVVVTACVWPSERERAERAGCDVFLPKPCLPDELLQEVRRVLPSSRLRRVRATSSKADRPDRAQDARRKRRAPRDTSPATKD